MDKHCWLVRVLHHSSCLAFFSLDGQTSVTIVGNVTLAVLPEGSHNIVVYAKDTAGNTGTSETIYFNIVPFPITLIVALRILTS